MSHQTLQQKVKRIISSGNLVDSPEMIASLKGLSTFCQPFKYEASNNRWILQSLLEKRDIELNKQMISSFVSVKDEIHKTEQTIDELVNQCNAITSRLHAVRQNTSNLMSQTTDLKKQKKTFDRRHELVSAFLARFQLIPDEIKELESNEITPEFFHALNRITQIQNDCKELLQTEQQKIGLDIMDDLAGRLECGYEKLYRWVQREAREMALNPEVQSNFVTAFQLLKPMPIYYQHCCQEIAQTRRVLLIKRFLTALTRGGPNGTPRPIEMHAHDSVKYVSDMLAWTHQALASERDFFSIVLGKNNTENGQGKEIDISNDKSNKGTKNNEDNDKAEIMTLLATVFEGISQPISMRIKSTLQSKSHIKAEVAFKLVNVLEFYSHTMTSLLLQESNFWISIENLATQARDEFFDLLKEQGENLIKSPPPYTHDLSCPKLLSDHIRQLSHILITYSDSFLPTTNFSAPEKDIDPVLSAVTDALIESAKISGSDLDLSDTAVYLLNIFHALIGVLSKFDVANARCESIFLLVKQQIEILVGEQTTHLLRQCGLSDLLNNIQQQTAKTNQDNAKIQLHQMDGLDPDSLSSTLNRFYSSLFAVGAFVIPQCDRILNSKTRQITREGIATSISKIYRDMYQTISDPKEGYDSNFINTLHSPNQIDTLLNIKPTLDTQ